MLRVAIALAFVLIAGTASAERRVALVFGIDDYKTIRALDNAVNDAQAIEKTLAGLDFEVFLETNRDLRRMRRALDDFREDAAGADVALVFYAGHGIEIAGENRLLPTDTDVSSLDALKASTLPLEEVREAVAEVGKVGLVVLDACRNDPFGAASADGRGAAALKPDIAEAARPGLGRMGRAENILFAFSAAPGETASDGEGGSSPFTTALTKYFGTDGLEIRSVLTLVQQEVYDLSRGKQLPYVESGLPQLFFAVAATDTLPERERLLLAMADITPDLRDEVERIAGERDMPLAPLYGALVSADLGSLSPEERGPKLIEAADAFVRVRAEMRSLASADPEVTRLRQEAEAKLSLGAFEAARTALSQAAALDGASRKTLKENFVARTLSEATTHFLAGDVAWAGGRLAEATISYKATIAVFGELSPKDVAGDDLDRLILANEALGNTAMAIGDYVAANQAIRDRLRLSQARSATDPSNLLWRRDAGVSHMMMGDFLATAGEYDGARQAFDVVLGIARDLAAADPDNRAWQRDLSVAHERVGSIRLALDDLPGALDAFVAGLAIREAMALAEPANSEWARLVSVMLNKIGDVRYALKELPAALLDYEAGLVVARRLAEADPSSIEPLRDLMVSLTRVADTKLALDDRSGALALYEEALAAARKLVEASPERFAYRRDLSVSLTKLGEVRAAADDISGAIAAFEEGLAIVETLVAADPSNVIWQRDIIIGHFRLARAGKAAKSHLEQALAVALALEQSGRLAPSDAYIPDLLRKEIAALARDTGKSP